MLKSPRRIICGLLFCVLLGWIFWLLNHAVTLKYTNSSGEVVARIECEAPADGPDLEESRDSEYETDCGQTRTQTLSTVMLLAIPASILGAFAFVPASQPPDREKIPWT